MSTSEGEHRPDDHAVGLLMQVSVEVEKNAIFMAQAWHARDGEEH